MSNPSHPMYLDWDRVDSPRLVATLERLKEVYPSRVPLSMQPSNDDTPYQSLLVYHGFYETLEMAKHICECGFRDVGVRNEGWYGKGVYFTPDIDYALAYAKSARRQSTGAERMIVIACELALFNPYPVADARTMKGRPIESMHYH